MSGPYWWVKINFISTTQIKPKHKIIIEIVHKF